MPDPFLGKAPDARGSPRTPPNNPHLSNSLVSPTLPCLSPPNRKTHRAVGIPAMLPPGKKHGHVPYESRAGSFSLAAPMTPRESPGPITHDPHSGHSLVFHPPAVPPSAKIKKYPPRGLRRDVTPGGKRRHVTYDDSPPRPRKITQIQESHVSPWVEPTPRRAHGGDGHGPGAFSGQGGNTA